jgi:hypothetical protein
LNRTAFIHPYHAVVVIMINGISMKQNCHANILSGCLLAVLTVLSPAAGAAEDGRAYPSASGGREAGDAFWSIPSISRQWGRPVRPQHWTIPSTTRRWENPQKPLRWTIPRSANDMK